MASQDYGHFPTVAASALGTIASTGATSAFLTSTVTVPTSVQPGTDILIFHGAAYTPQVVGNGAGTVSFNDGQTWTAIRDADVSSVIDSTVWWRPAVAGDAGRTVSATTQYGFTNARWTTELFVVRGANTASPVDANTGTTSVDSSYSSFSTPALTTADYDDLTLSFYAIQNVQPATATLTLPTAETAAGAGQTWPVSGSDGGGAMRAGYITVASPTANPALAATASTSNAIWAIVRVAFTLMGPPLAATLNSPANAVYQDMSGTPTASWTPNPSPGNGSQNAYAFRRKVSGAGSYNYWNASTSSWQSTIVWNPSTVSSVTFPANAWADGSIYNWSVATQESVDSLQGPFASDFTITAQTPPVVTVTAPTGTSANMTPAVTWTVSLAAGATQTGYRVVVYTAAQYTAGGFTPGTSAGVADSGQVNTTAGTWTIPAGALVNGTTYRAYVQVTETGGETSTWAYSGWTLSVDTPAPPIVTATTGTDPTTGLPLANLAVQGTDNLLSVNDASFEGGTGAWGSLVNATIAQSTAQALDGSYSLAVTATAAADMSTTSGTYPVQVGQTYTATAAFRAATTGRSVFVVLEWFNASAGLISWVNGTPVTDTTTGWTQATVTASAPTGAVTAAVKVYFTAPAASEVHYVDEAGIRPGSDTGWYRGGLVGSTTVALLRSDGLYVRGASTTNPLTIPASTQTATVVDPELVPANGYSYIASVSSVQSPTVTLTGPSSQASAQVMLPGGGGWWEFDPTDLSTAVAAQVLDFNPQITEQAAAHTVLGQATPNVIASVMGGVDGTATFETFDTPTYLGLTKLLTSQKTIFMSDPFGDNQGVTYVRFGPQTGGMSGGMGLRAKDAKLHASSSSAPHHELSVTWVAQPRPSV